MKKAVLFSAIGLLASGAVGAVEAVGRVISSTPVIQQVAVPRQVCNNQPMVVQQPNSGAGAVLGAIAGGVLGNQIGHGAGRAVATGVGMVGGAAVGNSIEGSGSYVQNVQQCTTQTFYENRTVAYNVTYEYAGQEHSVQLPYDPGATIRLELTPMAGTTHAACGRGSPDSRAPGYRGGRHRGHVPGAARDGGAARGVHDLLPSGVPGIPGIPGIPVPGLSRLLRASVLLPAGRRVAELRVFERPLPSPMSAGSAVRPGRGVSGSLKSRVSPQPFHMTTEQLAVATVTTQANVYFDGKCVSHSVTLADGTKKSVGVVLPSQPHLQHRRA